MFERILVPLDGSRFSELAIPTAGGLAARTGASLHLLTVASVPEGGMAGLDPAGGAVEATAEAATREAERYLHDALRRIQRGNPGVRTSSHVLGQGPAVSGIRQEAVRTEADLIVMTTHGRGGIQRAWFGSVAQGIVRRAERPVLLVRPTPGDGEANGDGDPMERAGAPFRRILVPLDGSRMAEKALDLAGAVAAADGAALTLFRVVPPLVASTYPFRTIPLRGEADGEEEGRRRAQSYLDDLAQGLRAQGVEVETGVKISHHPALEVLDHVRESGADLVTMTTHGYGAAGRLFLGSVADKVVRGSEAPVLLQRIPDDDEEAGPRGT